MDEFKDHFSGHAADYVAARPSYPDELFDWLAEQCPGRELVLDVATGNGQAARQLARIFDRVVATDASEEQVSKAIASDRVEYRVERAEALVLPEASVDLITAAQAAHWFDLEPFYGAAKRMMRPGGILALWCYERSCIHGDVDGIIETYYQALNPYWPPERRFVESGYSTLPFPFEPMETPEFEIVLSWSVTDMVHYLESWSASQRARKATQQDPLNEIRDELAEAWGEERREVRWPISMLVATLGD